MSERPLLPGEFAVLGLLAVQPMHGYEMARKLVLDGLDAVVPIEQSLLYTYIRNVEGRGLVSWLEDRVGLRPPRKHYHLTDVGQETLDAWLDEPVLRMRETRLDLLLKLYFLERLDPGRREQLVGRQISVCEAYRERLQRAEDRAEGFARLVAGSKRSAAEATLAWLREAAQASAVRAEEART